MINYYYIEDGLLRPCKGTEKRFKKPEVIRVITFDHVAIAQQRPRTRVVGIDRKGKPTGGKIYAQIYTVNSKYKEKILPLINPQEIFEEPTFMYVLALYTPPKSWSNKKTEEAYGQPKVTKPDGTNIMKFYEDLLEGHFMPKDQFINPGLCERYYATANKVVICIVPKRHVTFNIPQMVKANFIGKLIL